jgi:Tfp pilus assembly protein PilF
MVNPSPSLSLAGIGEGGGHLLPLFFLPPSATIGAVNPDKSRNSQEVAMPRPLNLKVNSLISFFALAVLAFTAHAQPGSSRSAPVIVEIRGEVRYGDTRAVAERALVRVEGFGSGVNGQTLTDYSGKFRFSGLGQAQYIVTVRAPGYREARQQVDLQTQPRAYLQFQLVPEKNEPIAPSGPAAIINIDVPSGAQKEFDQGRTILLDEKNVEKAITHLEKAISLHPSFAEAHLLLGTAYIDSKRWEKAELELKKTLEIDAKAVAAYFALGDVYRQQQKYSEAEKVLQDGLKLEPKSHQGHFTLGQVYFAKGDVARAGPEVGQALQLKPDYAEAYLLAGNLFLKTRNAAGALQMFEEYLRLEPKGQYAAQTREMVEKIRKAMAEKKQ